MIRHVTFFPKKVFFVAFSQDFLWIKLRLEIERIFGV